MIQPGVRGGRSIDLAPDKVAALGGEHWGRLYYKIKMPAPLPTGRLIHATIVHGAATSPLAKDKIDLRLATLLYYPNGDFKYFYNVQPPNGRKEIGPQSATLQKFNPSIPQYTFTPPFVGRGIGVYCCMAGCVVRNLTVTKLPQKP